MKMPFQGVCPFLFSGSTEMEHWRETGYGIAKKREKTLNLNYYEILSLQTNKFGPSPNFTSNI